MSGDAIMAEMNYMQRQRCVGFCIYFRRLRKKFSLQNGYRSLARCSYRRDNLIEDARVERQKRCTERQDSVQQHRSSLIKQASTVQDPPRVEAEEKVESLGN